MKRKTLDHDTAAKREHYCPMCRSIHYDNPPTLYECPQCGDEAYDCCIAGNNVICVRCEEDADDARHVDGDL